MTKEEAKKIYDDSIKFAEGYLELARIDRDTQKDKYIESCQKVKEAHLKFREVQHEAKIIYYQNIGEKGYADQL